MAQLPETIDRNAGRGSFRRWPLFAKGEKRMSPIQARGFIFSYTDLASDHDRLWDYHFANAETDDEKREFFKLGKAFVEDAYYSKGAYAAIVRDLLNGAALVPDWRQNARVLKCIDRLQAAGEIELLKRLLRSATANRIKKYWEYYKHRNHAEWGDTHRVAASEEKQLAFDDLDFAVELMNEIGESAEAERYRLEKSLLAENKRNVVKTKPDPRIMDDTVFWEVIDAGEDFDGMAEKVGAVTEKLATFGGRNIQKFRKILDKKMSAAYRWDIWALAYLAQGGCSDDAFVYFRAWLILQGRDLYSRGLENVEDILDSVPTGSATRAELLLYAAEEAYALRTGNVLKPVKSKQPLEPVGKAWEEDSIVADYPKIATYYGRN